MEDIKTNDAPTPVTDPERSHRVALKTTAGPMMTAAMSELGAKVLTSNLAECCASSSPTMALPLPDGMWEFNAAHATAWQIIPNMFHHLT